MADFSKALSKVLRWEGGWSDHPNDSGGATNKGITLATYRSVYGNGKSKEDLRRITDDEVVFIYRKNFWDVMKGDLIRSQSLAELIFDFIVNSGTGKLKQCQLHTNCVADGKIGPQTLGKWNSLPKQCFDDIWAYRKRFYQQIGVGKNACFLNGWLKRLDSYIYNG